MRLMTYLVIGAVPLRFSSLRYNIRRVTDEWSARAVFIFAKRESMRPSAPLIESVPTETPREGKKETPWCLRIIALLYSRSRSYRRTRTRLAGKESAEVRHSTRERERERREGGEGNLLRDSAPDGRARTSRARRCSRTFITRAYTYTPPRVHDGIEFTYGKGGLRGRGWITRYLGGHLSSKVLLFRRAAQFSSRRCYGSIVAERSSDPLQ